MDQLKKLSKSKKLVHVDDLNLSKAQIKKILSHISKKKRQMKGSGNDMAGEGVLDSLKKFFQGKTKIKPSAVMGGISGVLGLASIGVPLLAPVSTAAGVSSKVLAMTGRGLTLPGSGLSLPGGLSLPKSVQKLISSYPDVAKAILKKVKPGDSTIKTAKAIGVSIPIGMAIGGKLLFNYLVKHPDRAQDLVDFIAAGGTNMLGGQYPGKNPGKNPRVPHPPPKRHIPSSEHMPRDHEAPQLEGQGLKLAGSGRRKKKVGNKTEVFHERCEKTPGGLCKKDLMKNPRGKIVSRKKFNIGKKMYINNLKRSKPRLP